MKRPLLVALVVLIGSPAFACKKDEAPRSDPASTTQTAPTAVPLERGSKLLIGTWQAEEFIAASPSGSASAAALNAQIDSDAAKAVKVTYTADQVKVMIGGQTLSSTYVVREDGAGKCTLLNGKDTVVITFFDPDHMLIDRPGNPFAAKMRMRRLAAGVDATAP
jgi:hypothetical protein